MHHHHTTIPGRRGRPQSPALCSVHPDALGSHCLELPLNRSCMHRHVCVTIKRDKTLADTRNLLSCECLSAPVLALLCSELHACVCPLHNCTCRPSQVVHLVARTTRTQATAHHTLVHDCARSCTCVPVTPAGTCMQAGIVAPPQQSHPPVAAGQPCTPWEAARRLRLLGAPHREAGLASSPIFPPARSSARPCRCNAVACAPEG